MREYHLINSQKSGGQLLLEIHSAHNRMVKMKALMEQYFWWSDLNEEIENVVKSCGACMAYLTRLEREVSVKYKEVE